MSGFSNWDREAYRGRVGEEEAARRRGVIMGGRWGISSPSSKRLGFTQARLAEIMGVTRAGSPRSSTVKSRPSRHSPATSQRSAEARAGRGHRRPPAQDASQPGRPTSALADISHRGSPPMERA